MQRIKVFFGPNDPWGVSKPTDQKRRMAVSRENSESPFARLTTPDPAIHVFQDIAFAALGREDHRCRDHLLVLLGPERDAKRKLVRAFAEVVQIPFIEIAADSVPSPDALLEAINKELIAEGVGLVEVRRKNYFISPPAIVFIENVDQFRSDEMCDVLSSAYLADQHLRTESKKEVNFYNICWIFSSDASKPSYRLRNRRSIYLFVQRQSETTATNAFSTPVEPMDYSVRTFLCELLDEHGGKIADEPRRLKALLYDCCPQSRRETRVILEMLKAGIIGLLGEAGPTLPFSMVAAILTKRLSRELVMYEGAVLWAVESWAIAMEVSKEKSLGQTKFSQQTPVIATAKAVNLLPAEKLAKETPNWRDLMSQKNYLALAFHPEFLESAQDSTLKNLRGWFEKNKAQLSENEYRQAILNIEKEIGG